VLTEDPKYFDALHMLGLIALQNGDFRGAADILASALKINADVAAAHNNRGIALNRLGQSDAALQHFDKAVALKPAFADAHGNRAAVLRDLRRDEAALQSYDNLIALKPDSAEAYNDRGIVLCHLGRFEAALQSFDTSIRLNPEYAVAHNNRGNVLERLGRYPDALAAYDRTIALDPNSADAYTNRGTAFASLGRYDEALESYEKAIALNPDCIDAHWNLSLVCLQRGEFARGWKEHEWRWQNEKLAILRRTFAQPLWHGAEDLHDKTILLHADQGLGDTVQFSRYIPRVAALGARVVLEVQQPLHTCFEGFAGVTQVIARGDDLPDFDVHCPLSGLPVAFQTTGDSIPAPVPLTVDSSRAAKWREILGAKAARRVGVAWHGNVTHQNDHNRSVALKDFITALPPGFEYVSLQHALREYDDATLKSRPDVRHVGTAIADCADVTALISEMDLVVSVDTSIAHLAGTLGKATWILLPYNPDWRWLLKRNDSPWYPSARLFRQLAPGDWQGIFQNLRAALIRMP
jgi:tetratricopeptide (TPR) repeat protein